MSSRMWLGVRNGMLSVIYFCFNISFYVSIEYLGNHRTFTVLSELWPPFSFFGIIPDFNLWYISLILTSYSVLFVCNVIEDQV